MRIMHREDSVRRTAGWRRGAQDTIAVGDHVNRDELLRSRQYLSHIGVWPSARQLHLEGWLANFRDELDIELAEELLAGHVHLDEEQITHAVAATIRSISGMPRFGDAGQRRTEWPRYLDRVIISFPLGQDGDPTGSGYIFGRLASEKLGFPESQVKTPDQLVRTLAQTSEPFDVIMLDDITASGTQFKRCWNRKTQTPRGRYSLADMATNDKLASIYYLPVAATVAAQDLIERECRVKVLPTYLLTPDYSALDSDSRIIRPQLRHRVQTFLDRHSPRTGHDQYGNAGYDDMALAVSFHHGCPNNTVPVLQWAAPRIDWTPLVS